MVAVASPYAKFLVALSLLRGPLDFGFSNIQLSKIKWQYITVYKPCMDLSSKILPFKLVVREGLEPSSTVCKRKMLPQLFLLLGISESTYLIFHLVLFVFCYPWPVRTLPPTHGFYSLLRCYLR